MTAMRVKAPVRHKWPSPSRAAELLEGIPYRSVYEPFAGQAQGARHFMRLGKRVTTSDLLEGHFCWARALVANPDRHVGAARIQEWLQVIRDPAVATRFSPWANRLFTPEETIWLGIWKAHLSRPGLDETERALGAVAVSQVIGYWRTFNRKELQNKPLTPAGAFQHYVQTVNGWVFNNGQANQALRGDAYHHAPRVEADLLFCYPPTDQGYFDYPDVPTLFESWVKGDPDLVLPGQAEAVNGPPTLGLPLTDPGQFGDALHRFLARCTHIPVWVLAFNDRYPIDEDGIAAIVQDFRPVVRRAPMTIRTGERGLAPRETLLVAR